MDLSMDRSAAVDARGVVQRLRELDARSGGRRVAWTGPWREEREALMDALAARVPELTVDRDEAGNLWAVLPGRTAETVVIGGHLDCVPGGGWLDGCLGTVAAAEVLAAIAAAGRPDRTVAVVDWADEEGSRFGHSVLGSSAAAGRLDPATVAGLRDADGATLADALRANGIDVERMPRAAARLRDVVAYLELHIEQGPVLDAAGRAAAAVDGCFGVRRARLRFDGQAAHAGATPLHMRRDPVLAAARFALAIRDRATAASGLATIGVLEAQPATQTAVPASVGLTLDLRHRDLAGLEELDRAAVDVARVAAETEGCTLAHTPVFALDPVAFDAGLVERARRLLGDGGGDALTSGPLHDAAAIAGAGIPTVMIFARTLGGISHSREEDAREEDLVVAIDALGALAFEVVSLN